MPFSASTRRDHPLHICTQHHFASTTTALLQHNEAIQAALEHTQQQVGPLEEECRGLRDNAAALQQQVYQRDVQLQQLQGQVQVLQTQVCDKDAHGKTTQEEVVALRRMAEQHAQDALQMRHAHDAALTQVRV